MATKYMKTRVVNFLIFKVQFTTSYRQINVFFNIPETPLCGESSGEKGEKGDDLLLERGKKDRGESLVL